MLTRNHFCCHPIRFIYCWDSDIPVGFALAAIIMMFFHLGIAVRLNGEHFIIIRAAATLCMFYSFQPYEPFKPYKILGATTNQSRDSAVFIRTGMFTAGSCRIEPSHKLLHSSFKGEYYIFNHPNMIRVILNHHSGTSVSQTVKPMKFEVLLPVFPVQLLGLQPGNDGCHILHCCCSA